MKRRERQPKKNLSLSMANKFYIVNLLLGVILTPSSINMNMKTDNTVSSIYISRFTLIYLSFSHI